jgi:hypothetical protein
MKYYQKALELEKAISEASAAGGVVAAAPENGLPSNTTTLYQQCILEELNLGDPITNFANMIDNNYKEAMINCIGFTVVTDKLLPDEKMENYYNEFQRIFSYSHFVFATAASLRSYTISTATMEPDSIPTTTGKSVPHETTPGKSELHAKHRKILYLFLGLIRTKSNRLLDHRSQTEPFGYYFKGRQQSG